MEDGGQLWCDAVGGIEAHREALATMAPARQPEVQDGVVSPAKHTPAHQPQGVLALKLCFDWVLQRQNIPFGFEETVVLCRVLRGEDAVEVSAAAVLLFELTNNLRAPHR